MFQGSLARSGISKSRPSLISLRQRSDTLFGKSVEKR